MASLTDLMGDQGFSAAPESGSNKAGKLRANIGRNTPPTPPGAQTVVNKAPPTPPGAQTVVNKAPLSSTSPKINSGYSLADMAKSAESMQKTTPPNWVYGDNKGSAFTSGDADRIPGTNGGTASANKVPPSSSGSAPVRKNSPESSAFRAEEGSRSYGQGESGYTTKGTPPPGPTSTGTSSDGSLGSRIGGATLKWGGKAIGLVSGVLAAADAYKDVGTEGGRAAMADKWLEHPLQTMGDNIQSNAFGGLLQSDESKARQGASEHQKDLGMSNQFNDPHTSNATHFLNTAAGTISGMPGVVGSAVSGAYNGLFGDRSKSDNGKEKVALSPEETKIAQGKMEQAKRDESAKTQVDHFLKTGEHLPGPGENTVGLALNKQIDAEDQAWGVRQKELSAKEKIAGDTPPAFSVQGQVAKLPTGLEQFAAAGKRLAMAKPGSEEMLDAHTAHSEMVRNLGSLVSNPQKSANYSKNGGEDPRAQSGQDSGYAGAQAVANKQSDLIDKYESQGMSHRDAWVRAQQGNTKTPDYEGPTTFGWTMHPEGRMNAYGDMNKDQTPGLQRDEFGNSTGKAGHPESWGHPTQGNPYSATMGGTGGHWQAAHEQENDAHIRGNENRRTRTAGSNTYTDRNANGEIVPGQIGLVRSDGSTEQIQKGYTPNEIKDRADIAAYEKTPDGMRQKRLVDLTNTIKNTNDPYKKEAYSQRLDALLGAAQTSADTRYEKDGVNAVNTLKAQREVQKDAFEVQKYYDTVDEKGQARIKDSMKYVAGIFKSKDDPSGEAGALRAMVNIRRSGLNPVEMTEEQFMDAALQAIDQQNNLEKAPSLVGKMMGKEQIRSTGWNPDLSGEGPLKDEALDKQQAAYVDARARTEEARKKREVSLMNRG